jgi:hypothetical protein
MPGHEPDPNIHVIIVVSGQPQDIHINIHEPVANLIKKALEQSGNHGQPVGEWELRRVDGSLVDQNIKIMEAHIPDGATLFLTPRAGAGG